MSYAGAGNPVTVNLSTGSATGHGTDTLTSIENVTGSSNNDSFINSSADNVINGGASGTDTVSYSAAHAVTINLAAGTANGRRQTTR